MSAAPRFPVLGAGDELSAVLAYHRRSKHDFQSYARSLGHLDWACQPAPFRAFTGAPRVPLPLPDNDDTPAYAALFAAAQPPQPLTLRALSRFCHLSLAVSAWKELGGERWALRVNPSSGNLHPTEGYLLLPPLPDLAPAPSLQHYAPREHALQRRALLDGATWAALTTGLPTGAFLVALNSIPWRESWKYGERAYRYCQHDAGHALAALRLAAAALGWRLVLLPGAADDLLERLLGLDREDDFPGSPVERELPELLAAVWPGCAGCHPWGWHVDPAAAAGAAAASWSGRAAPLSAGHHEWPVLAEIARACRVRGQEEPPSRAPGPPAREAGQTGDAAGPSAAAVIRGRRSAVAMDGRTTLARDRFYAMLARLLPARCVAPWDALPWAPLVHLALLVHRVEGVDPGLYLLARDTGGLDALREELRPEFSWRPAPACPAELPLRLLAPGDVRAVAARLSCGQAIAGDGVFSAGMVARFAPQLAARGPAWYRRLFWECGAIGQMLYLEAEAAGLRGTGIGCYFDDPVHALLGLRGDDWQSLYHFTVGGALQDRRLTALPAYPPPD